MAMTSTHAKDEDQRSVGSKAGMETDGRTPTDGRTRLIANAVGNDPL